MSLSLVARALPLATRAVFARSAHTLARPVLASPARPQIKMAAAATSSLKTLASLAAKPQVKAGDAVPSVAIRTEDMDTTIDFSTLKGKNVIVTVPGAFTPTCHSQVPSFLEHADEIKAKGVDGIYVVSVNDLFVVNAWKKGFSKTDSGVKFAADDKGELAAALGIVLEATGLLGSPRLKRSVLVVQDGKVVDVIIEENSGESTVTQADKVLSKL